MATQLSVATTEGMLWNQFTLFYLDILSAPSFDLKLFLEGQGRDSEVPKADQYSIMAASLIVKCEMEMRNGD